MKIKNEIATKFSRSLDGVQISQAPSFECDTPQTVFLSARQLLEILTFLEKQARTKK